MTRVLIADEHPPTRAGVRAVLEQDGFVVCAEAGTARAAVAAADEHVPDLCVLDAHMPGGGVTAAAEISRRVPGTSIVMLTGSHAEEDLFEALRAGAVGFLHKGMNPDRLGAALRGVLSGEAAIPRSLVTPLIRELTGREHRRGVLQVGARTVRLSNREWETLSAMRDGMTTAQMAEHFGVAPVTVRSQVAAIVRKLHVRDRQEAVAVFTGAARRPAGPRAG
jgi:two-component system, NarL family, nitrate/nitrite response regulator NarL